MVQNINADVHCGFIYILVSTNIVLLLPNYQNNSEASICLLREPYFREPANLEKRFDRFRFVNNSKPFKIPFIICIHMVTTTRVLFNVLSITPVQVETSCKVITCRKHICLTMGCAYVTSNRRSQLLCLQVVI